VFLPGNWQPVGRLPSKVCPATLNLLHHHENQCHNNYYERQSDLKASKPHREDGAECVVCRLSSVKPSNEAADDNANDCRSEVAVVAREAASPNHVTLKALTPHKPA